MKNRAEKDKLLEELERTLLDPDYIIKLAIALKVEREASVLAEQRLEQLLDYKFNRLFEQPDIEFVNNIGETVSKLKADILSGETFVNRGGIHAVDALPQRERKLSGNIKQMGETTISYTPTEAADVLGLCKTTILRYIQRGELKARKYGKKIQIDEIELEAFKVNHAT